MAHEAGAGGEPDLRPYAGWWVALRGGRVIGVGKTEREAYLAAKSSRPKEEPAAVTFVAGEPDASAGALYTLFGPGTLAGRVRQALLAGAGQSYLVGGTVRDALLGRESHDLDFSVDAGALELGRRLADELGAGFCALDPRRGTARVVVEDASGERTYVDIATLAGGAIESDVAERDFTLNALAVDLQDLRLVDYHGGLDDMRQRRLRLVSPLGIADDPIRAMRAVRLAAELGLSVEPATEAAVARDGAGLTQTSAERIRDEVVRILALPASAGPLGRLERLGLLAHFWPEAAALKGVTQTAPHRLDVWEHTLLTVTRLEQLLALWRGAGDAEAGQLFAPLERFGPALRTHLDAPMADRRPRGLLLKLAALLHDVGKPGSRRVEESGRIRFLGHETLGCELAFEMATRLRFSAAEAMLVRTIVQHHMRPLSLAQAGAVTALAAHRFFRDAGAAGADIALLALADARATAPGPLLPAQAAPFAALVAAVQRLLDYGLGADGPEAQPPLLSGRDLIEDCGLTAGPQIGRWLRLIRERQVSGELTTREEALQWVRCHPLEPKESDGE